MPIVILKVLYQTCSMMHINVLRCSPPTLSVLHPTSPLRPLTGWLVMVGGVETDTAEPAQPSLQLCLYPGSDNTLLQLSHFIPTLRYPLPV